MSRFRSLSTLSVAVVVAAGLVAIGGLTQDATAKPDKSEAGVSYQVTLNHGGGVETITALGWTHEITNTVAFSPSGGLATGKRQHKPLLILKRIDKSSPLLLKACANGHVLPGLTL